MDDVFQSRTLHPESKQTSQMSRVHCFFFAVTTSVRINSSVPFEIIDTEGLLAKVRSPLTGSDRSASSTDRCSSITDASTLWAEQVGHFQTLAP